MHACADRLKIENLTVEDVEEVVDLEEQATNTGWSRNDLIASIHAGHVCRKLLVSDALCGYCIVRVVGAELEVLNIVISRAYHERGLGGYLLDQILGCQAFSEVTQNWLEVRSGNLAARALYHKTGFSVVGKRRGYYSKSGNPEDALIMRRSTKLSGSG